LKKLKSKGPSINIARFEPEGDPLGVIQIIHGFGEHKAAYESFSKYFTRHGYACVAYDQRGHGELPKNKLGIVASYNDFLDDVGTVRELIKVWYPNKPVILYGHSMGGNIALNYLLRRSLDYNSQSEFAKAVLETPWFRLHKNQPMPLVLLARILGTLNYKLALESGLITDALSRDPKKIERLKNDKLYHNRMGLRIFTQITDAGEYILLHANEIKLPVLLLGGEDDRIVCIEAIRELNKKTGENVIYHEEPQGRHVLHDEIEPVKSEILKRIRLFLY
jgi:lysophospholipase